MKILLTAFEPFGGDKVNPALEAVTRVSEARAGAKLVKMTVPVEYERSGLLVIDAIRREKPDAVLCVGQAGGRSAVTPERTAVNLDNAKAPDNAGEIREHKPILPGSPERLPATLPVDVLAERIRALGVPSEVSEGAGTYVCNHLMYSVLYETRDTPVRAGFIHVPFIPEQTVNRPDAPSLPLSDIVRALECALRTITEI